MIKSLKPYSILLINDKQKYNARYRSELIATLNKNYRVSSRGCFDNFCGFLRTFLQLVFINYTVIVSSNLKSNLLNLLIFWRKKIIIFNGLGRYRQSKILRSLISLLFKIQVHKNLVFVQNYADYRYFRKHAFKLDKLCWMPGSGGTKRHLGSDQSRISVITRDEKLPSQIDSITEFLSECSTHSRVVLVGINNMGKTLTGNLSYDSVGYVDQTDILKFSNALLVPEGYGEGVPHTLVDAIISGAEIYLSKFSYIRYGFYKHTSCEFLDHKKRWARLNLNQELREIVASEFVIYEVVSEVNNFIIKKES